jgi:hypothetical protein
MTATGAAGWRPGRAWLVVVVSSWALSACSTVPRTAVLAPVASGPSGRAAAAPPGFSEAESALGASAFARRYFELLNVAYQRLDPSALVPMADPRCRSCANFAGDIAAMVQAGHRLVGDSFVVLAADAPPVEDHTAVVDLEFRSPGPVEYDASGAVLLRRPVVAGGVYLVTLQRSGIGWRVREVARP